MCFGGGGGVAVHVEDGVESQVPYGVPTSRRNSVYCTDLGGGVCGRYARPQQAV